MRFHRATTLILVVLIGCLALFGCKKKEETPPPAPTPEVSATPPPAPEATPANVPFKVTSVDLGKAVAPDGKITEPADTFGPKDVIYASVASEGTATSVKLHAKWTYGAAGKIVDEKDLSIAPTGPANTAFHISNTKPWPAGKYKVEITADGNPAGSKDFEVKK